MPLWLRELLWCVVALFVIAALVFAVCALIYT